MSQWRLWCPECDRRTFHREGTDADGTKQVECVACGDTEPLADRKRRSRQRDPNPDAHKFRNNDPESENNGPAGRNATLRKWSP